MLSYLKQSKYRKSSSTVHLKTNPENAIQFNPKQFTIGQSKIQRLSSKIQARRNSLSVLPKTQKQLKRTIDNDLQIELLKSINHKLSTQNKQLKKQISNYQNQLKNLKKNHFLDQVIPQPNKIIKDNVNKTKCSSKVLSLDNQTALYSSKQISYGQFQSINSMFQAFIKRAIKPSLLQYSGQISMFFQSIQETYIKLKLIFQSLPKNTKRQDKQLQKCEFLLKKLNQICQFKIKTSKLSYKKEISYYLHSIKVEKQQNKKQEFLQLMSGQQVIQMFQKYILKILRSQKVLKSLKINIVVRKFINKLNQI